MRSRADAVLPVMAVTVLLAVAAPAAVPAPVTAQARAIDDAEIARAMEKVRADPQLALERTIKSLRWRNSQQPKRPGRPAWMAWIVGLFSWIGESARLLVWAAAAILVVLVARYVIAVASRRSVSDAADPFVAPTHVRDLDIRPESLPDDIGGAARALWDRGDHRAALALLYRGLLSRLAHVHSLPVRASTTEGDCLALSNAHLPPEPRDYASSLVRAWQRAVYGSEAIGAAAAHALCDGFAPAMNRTAPSPATRVEDPS